MEEGGPTEREIIQYEEVKELKIQEAMNEAEVREVEMRNLDQFPVNLPASFLWLSILFFLVYYQMQALYLDVGD